MAIGDLLRAGCVVTVLLGSTSARSVPNTAVGVAAPSRQIADAPSISANSEAARPDPSGAGDVTAKNNAAEKRAAAERLIVLQHRLSRERETRARAALQMRNDELLLSVVDGSRMPSDMHADIAKLEKDVAALHSKPQVAAPNTTAPYVVRMHAVCLGGAALLSLVALGFSLAAFLTRRRMMDKALKDAGLI